MDRRISLEALQDSLDRGGLRNVGGRISLASADAEFRDYVAGVVRAHINRRALLISVGCGRGELEVSLARSGKAPICMDLRPAVTSAIRERRLPFVRGDAHRLPFGDGAAGGVLMSESIGQVDPERALAEMRRVLRPGGVLILTSYHLADPDPGDTLRLPYPFAGSTGFLGSAVQNARAAEYRRRATYHLYPVPLLGLFLRHAGLVLRKAEVVRHASERIGEIDMILLVAARPRGQNV